MQRPRPTEARDLGAALDGRLVRLTASGALLSVREVRRGNQERARPRRFAPWSVSGDPRHRSGMNAVPFAAAAPFPNVATASRRSGAEHFSPHIARLLWGFPCMAPSSG